MTPAELCESLLRADTPEDHARWMDEAETLPECVEWLLAHAARTLPTAPAEALLAAQHATELARRQQDGRAAAQAERIQAQALRAQGKHGEALTAFDAAAENARRAGDAKLAAQVQMGRIDSLGWLGRYEEAVTFAKGLITALRREQAEEDAAKALVNLGNVHYRRDRFQEALRCYEEASGLLAQSGDVGAAAQVDFNRANILSEHHQVEEAMRLFRGTREIFVSQKAMMQVAMIDFNIGVLHLRSGEYTAALTTQERARREFIERGQTLEVAKCDADMADVYRMLNLRTEALAGYERAIAVFKTLALDYERGRAELGRAAILAAQNEWDGAGQALDNAETVFQQHCNRVQQAHVRLLRAWWRKAQGDDEGAAAEAQAAERSFARFRLFSRAAEARYLEADIALQAGLNVTRKMAAVGSTARRYAQGWLECRAERALGQYHARQGRPTRALRHLRLSVRALEAARTLVPGEELHTAFVSDKLAVYEDIVDLLLTRGRTADIAEAFEYVERSKSRLLLERIQAALMYRESQELERQEPERQEKRNLSGSQQPDLAPLRARLNQIYSQMQPQEGDGSRRLGTTPLMNAQTLSDVETAYHIALRSAELESRSGLFRLVQVATAAELQERIEPDEVLLEFYIVKGEVGAFVLTKESIQVRPLLAAAGEIERQARRLRFHLHRAGSAPEYVEGHAAQLLTGAQKPLARLYDLLLRPLEPWLSAKKVTVVLHGGLHGLPIHAFFDGTQYALDRWEFVYSPSATFHYTRKKHASPPSGFSSEGEQQTSPVIMGVPDEQLTQIGVEVANLAKTLPDAQVFCGPSATLSAFYTHAPRSRLLHLATHALFRADNPLFSGLRFADGWLLARDLYVLRLHCDLVTLSACRTGQAQIEAGDEMFGLLRGFLAAGARSVAVSLWSADDTATAALMTKFYILMAQGFPRAAALRAAQQTVRRQWPHPYHWAAFALFGER